MYNEKLLTSPFSYYRSLGLRVFPVNRETKKPAVKWKKYQSELPSIEQCKEWDKGNYNVAIVTGSGLLVFDIDGDKGRESLKSLPNMPKTWKVKTGRGEHYYFKLSAGQAFKSKIGALLGIDIKCEAGYVVAPPSIHSSGKSYEWIVSPDDMPEPAPVPGFILDLLKPKTEKSCESYQSGESFIPIEDIAFITGIEALKVEKSFEGSRNQTLNIAAFNVGKHLHFGIDEQPAKDRLLQAALQVGLHEDEAIATINSGINAGKKKPVPFSPALNDWPDIVDGENPEPYPVDALPTIMRDAVLAYQASSQQPTGLIVLAALTPISLAAQGHFDVVRGHLKCPISLNLLGIAGSGAKKTSALKKFMSSIKEFQKQKLKEYNAAMKFYKNDEEDIKSYKKQRDSLLRKGDIKTVEILESKIYELQAKTCNKPLKTKILYNDATIEALIKNVSEGYPSFGVVNDEGGIFSGGHSFKTENATAAFGLYNKLWDADDFNQERIGRGSIDVIGRRATVCTMIQSKAFKRLSRIGDGLAANIGFFPRALMCYYPKIEKQSFYKETSEQKKQIDRYCSRIREILEIPLNMEEDTYALEPRELYIQDNAMEIWENYFNEVGMEIPSLNDDEASIAVRSAEQAARLAGLFQILEDSDSDTVSEENMFRGCTLAKWHLNEGIRILNLSAKVKSNELLDWLQERENPFKLAKVAQYGPSSLRNAQARKQALSDLESRGYIKISKVNGHKMICLNPKCLD
jgi:hypothetical protein